MTVSKLTNNVKPLDEVDKINEIIDELDNANVAIDNKSITKNSSDKLQTVGVIDSNNTTNAIKTWTGTKAQYDAIVTKDATTLYNITDDITDNNSIVVDLNGKADIDLTNCTVPYVISRTPNEQGGVVEIWSDGYCIQNGYIASTSTDVNKVSITLSQSYKDNNYIVTLGNYALTSVTDSTVLPKFGCLKSKTVNSIEITIRSTTYQTGCYWRTEGYIR